MGRRKGGRDWPRPLVVRICRDFWVNLAESQRVQFARTRRLELHRGAGGDPALTRTLGNIRFAIFSDDETTTLAQALTRSQLYDIVKAHLAQYLLQGEALHRVRRSRPATTRVSGTGANVMTRPQHRPPPPRMRASGALISSANDRQFAAAAQAACCAPRV